jgi:hypothetical protein
MRLGVEHLDWLNKQTPSECSLGSVGNNVATKEWLVDLWRWGFKALNLVRAHQLAFCVRMPPRPLFIFCIFARASLSFCCASEPCMHLPRLPAYADRAPPGLSNQLASNVLRNLNARICTNARAPFPSAERVAQTFMQILIVSSAWLPLLKT